MTALYKMISSLTVLLFSTALWAHPFQLKTELSHQKIKQGEKSTAYVKVALTGLEMDTDRPPLNIALVIDRSGSMRGQRIQQAKEAARLAVNMLKPNDIISVIAYDNHAELLVPATKVGDGKMVQKGIQRLRASGSTALYAGTDMGGKEVVKFLSKEFVNRVILLSDGIANIGPSSPNELAELGKSLARQGIAVSTVGLGLGYNEDLMAQLAAASDGNHSFVEHPTKLAHIMSLELNDALAVVAQDVKVKLTFPKGVRPVKALGRDADFSGQNVTSSIKQLITGTERFVLIEVEVNPKGLEDQFELAAVKIEYRNQEGDRQEASDKVQVSLTKNAQDMDKSVQASVMESVVELVAREKQEMAIKLKDEGKDKEALQVMNSTNDYLRSNSVRYDSKKLRVMEAEAQEDTAVIKQRGKGKKWSRTRKAMRKKSYSSKAQMAF